MRDTIISQIRERTGITEDQARMALDTVVNVLKERMPPAMATQVEAVINGGNADLGSMMGGLGGMFGKKE